MRSWETDLHHIRCRLNRQRDDDVFRPHPNSENARVVFRKSNQFADVTARDAGIGVCRSIVDADAIRGFINYGSTGEHDVGYVSVDFIFSFGCHDMLIGSIQDVPRFIAIENCGPYAVNETVARIHHPVIDHQPTIIDRDWNGARPNLRSLPPLTLLAPAASHHEPMPSPMTHVRALADVYVAKRGVAIVAWPT